MTTAKNTDNEEYFAADSINPISHGDISDVGYLDSVLHQVLR